MKPVDFFIVGAPKSGTTALYSYLRDHPDIFFPNHKEPSFFATDYPALGGRLKDYESYTNLYNLCEDNQLTGDASVVYLGSFNAAQAIKQHNPEAKIIIMLRNPVDLFISEHAQLLFSFYEDIESPIEAWRKQVARQSGNAIPKSCREPEVLQYLKTCRLGENTQRYFEHFPSEQIHLIFFDDFCDSSELIYKNTCAFLQVNDDQRQSFPRVNEAKAHKNSALAKWLIAPPGVFGKCHAWLRRKIATSNSQWLNFIESFARKIIAGKSHKKNNRAELSPEDKNEILSGLMNDITLLEVISHRDLSHWKKV